MSSIEQQVEARKERLERLKGLKRKAEFEIEKPAGSVGEKNEPAQVLISGRNYEAGHARLGFYDNPLDSIHGTVEEATQQAEQETKHRMENVMQTSDIDLEALQPKSVAWDLKRDIQDRLDLLDAKTDNVIVRIVKTRLSQAMENDD